MITPDDASLGLLAFCLLMWVTLPWAFSEPVEKGRKNPVLILKYIDSEEELESPKDWLESGAMLYAASGFFYLLTVLVDLAKPNINTLTNFNPAVIFVVANVLFIMAIYYTHLVISFVLRPESLPNTLFEGLSIERRDDIVVPAALGLVDFMLLITYFPGMTMAEIPLLSHVGQLLLASLILGLAGLCILVVLAKRERSVWNVVATVLLYLPIVVFLYVAFGGTV